MRGPSMGEWLLSRRDRLIVARHEVPGLAMQRAPSRKDGRRVEVMVSPEWREDKENLREFSCPEGAKEFSPGFQSSKPAKDKVSVDARGPGAGRAKLRLSRGFPVVLARQHHPPQMLSRIVRSFRAARTRC